MVTIDKRTRKRKKFIEYFVFRFETSAKDNSNIEEATRSLISAIVELQQENVNNDNHDENNVSLDQQYQQQTQNSGCC